ncbi:Pectate lyase superfamily protein [Amycolatopsis marina]|uniref:Pectate lyase superfamily protein n=1 Tax=Amycolatopsis marina TaxID=490629 RepID=A0A1I1BWF6_9PSEU|nr:glycoside hydrolase family 28 protein [Amycolatopsis marina]SFB52988.1 Pectate lyase superfamily protein [Amycolatopsis marina]
MRKLSTRTAAVAAVAAGSLMISVPSTSAVPGPANHPHSNNGSATGWDLAERIVKQVKPPGIPSRPFDIVDYGADGTGTRDSSRAFAGAIDAASRKGGRVVVPPGEYLTGPIHLQSDVELHVSEGATVRFSQDPADYLPPVLTRWEGVELYNYSPFIYAHDVKNVAITGKGVLDGQADEDHWWPWKEESDGQGGVIETEDRDALFEMAENGVPVEQRNFGAESQLRPNFVQFYNSSDILVKDVTLTNSPMWMIHPVLSENVTVDGVNLDSPNGPNSDGVDPESSRNVVIKNSRFNNGDDCIAIKSGRNADGRRINAPSENIVIHDNYMQDGHGGVTIGSEMSGSVRNVFAEDNVMDSAQLQRALRIKTNSVRGGVVEHIYFRGNQIPQIGDEVIRVNFQYEEGDAGEFTPTVREIHIEDVHSVGGAFALYLRGYERSPISDVTITNSTFEDVQTPMLLEHVEGLQLDNVEINGELYDGTITQGDGD